MTVLVWRAKCLGMRPEKGSFRGVACSPEAEPASSGAAGNTVDQYQLTPLQREVVRPIWELKSESQNGNSGLQCRAVSQFWCERRGILVTRVAVE
jgi:hypothetical protein